MIYDTLNNLPNYLGVSDNLDTVIEYIMARDITTLPAGRTRIDGDKAVVTVSTVTPQTSDKALFQRHDNHITLETDLDGSELFEVSLAELTPTKPTDEAADITVGTAGTSIAGMLCEGRFALYLAGEPYKSGLKAQGCGKLKKAVFSIELDPDEEEAEEGPKGDLLYGIFCCTGCKPVCRVSFYCVRRLFAAALVSAVPVDGRSSRAGAGCSGLDIFENGR